MPELERFGAGLVQSNRIALTTRAGPAQNPPRPGETKGGESNTRLTRRLIPPFSPLPLRKLTLRSVACDIHGPRP